MLFGAGNALVARFFGTEGFTFDVGDVAGAIAGVDAGDNDDADAEAARAFAEATRAFVDAFFFDGLVTVILGLALPNTV